MDEESRSGSWSICEFSSPGVKSGCKQEKERREEKVFEYSHTLPDCDDESLETLSYSGDEGDRDNFQTAHEHLNKLDHPSRLLTPGLLPKFNIFSLSEANSSGTKILAKRRTDLESEKRESSKKKTPVSGIKLPVFQVLSGVSTEDTNKASKPPTQGKKLTTLANHFLLNKFKLNFPLSDGASSTLSTTSGKKDCFNVFNVVIENNWHQHLLWVKELDESMGDCHTPPDTVVAEVVGFRNINCSKDIGVWTLSLISHNSSSSKHSLASLFLREKTMIETFPPYENLPIHIYFPNLKILYHPNFVQHRDILLHAKITLNANSVMIFPLPRILSDSNFSELPGTAVLPIKDFDRSTAMLCTSYHLD